MRKTAVMKTWVFACVLALAAAGSAAVVDAVAGDQLIAGLARKAGGAAPAAPPAKAKIPPQQLYLVRSTLATLADANRTGNYSVLRDLAAPQLQAKHSAADLALIFTDARRRPIDVTPVLMLEPDTFAATRPSAEALQLAGSIAAGTERVTFKLLYAAVGGHWRIADIGIGIEGK